jgi:antitoxin (DNA-binding transcriptional repressor) of toxin-antitoxin stability system
MLNGQHEEIPGQPTPGRPPPTSQQLVNVHQAKTQLSQLLQAVEQGLEEVIARSGVPIARLVAWQAPAQALAAPWGDGRPDHAGR